MFINGGRENNANNSFEAIAERIDNQLNANQAQNNANQQPVNRRQRLGRAALRLIGRGGNRNNNNANNAPAAPANPTARQQRRARRQANRAASRNTRAAIRARRSNP